MHQGSRSAASRWQRGAASGLLALAGGACIITSAPTANAHSSMPSAPTSVRVVKVSRSSFTVSANGSAHHFRLFAAFRKRALATTRISHARKSHFRRTPHLTLHKLHYTTRPFFYRVEARNGKRRRFSAIEGTVTLQPAAPTNLQAFTSTSGTTLSWHSGQASGFLITQATDPEMTQNVRTYTTENQDHVFTPYGLEEGTTYYFDVMALNGIVESPATPVVSTMTQSEQQPVRVMTYNIRKATSDGRIEGGNRVAPWSQRRTGVADLINNAAPDAVAIQEGAALVAPDVRQVDDLVTALGGTYSLAETEVPPWERGHTVRAGTYILYRNDAVTAVDGEGGHWELGDDRFAAYQVLKKNQSGAQFLFVVPHLQVTGQPGGTDQGRENEDKSMVSQANAYAASLGGLPIVYGGDFNSDPSHGHAFNGPSDYNLSIGLDDAFDVAQSHTNARFNSANGYETKPPALGLRIDYVFVTPGIAVTSWSLLLDTVDGRFQGVIPSDHNPLVANLLIPYEAVS